MAFFSVVVDFKQPCQERLYIPFDKEIAIAVSAAFDEFFLISLSRYCDAEYSFVCVSKGPIGV